MAKKGKGGKTDARSVNSTDTEAATKSLARSLQLEVGENTILTIRTSIAAAPVGGKGPRPKKDELQLMLMATLAALLSGAPMSKKDKLAFDLMAAGVGGEGRKPRIINP